MNDESNKRVMVISPRFPWPADQGDALDISTQLETLLEFEMKVKLVVVAEPQYQVAESQIADMPQVNHFEWALARRPYRWQPIQSQLIECLQTLLDEFQPDVVLVQYADFAFALKELNFHGAPLIYRAHNYETKHLDEKERMKVHSSVVARAKWRFIHQRHLRMIRRHEALMHQISDHVLFIGRADMRMSEAEYDVKRGFWMPSLVKVGQWIQRPDPEVLHLAYLSGHYGNYTNRQGADQLINHIIPAVESVYGQGVLFHFYGRGAADYLKPQANIVIHDYVDDLDAQMRAMHAVVSPVSIGWGCKLKMWYSLCQGLPVLGDPITFRGVEGRELEGALICKTADDYIEAIELLLDHQRYQEISIRSHSACQQIYHESLETFLSLCQNSKPE